jgi:hypothetical protein
MSEREDEPATFSQALARQEVEINSWDDFQNHLTSYRGDHRYKWCFRGHANSAWTLAPSLERLIPDRRLESAQDVERVLLNRFRRQAN